MQTATASTDLHITTLMSCSVFNQLEYWSGSCKFVFFTDLLFKRTKRWEDLSHVDSRLLVGLFSKMMNDVFCSWLPPGWTRVNKQDRKWLSYTFFPADIWSEQRCSLILTNGKWTCFSSLQSPQSTLQHIHYGSGGRPAHQERCSMLKESTTRATEMFDPGVPGWRTKLYTDQPQH